MSKGLAEIQRGIPGLPDAWKVREKKLEPAKPTGLGDVVEKLAAPIAKVLGVTGCGGCAKRKAAFNKLIPDVKRLTGMPVAASVASRWTCKTSPKPDAP